MLAYAHVCSRMLTYAHVCSRMLTYATTAPPRWAEQVPGMRDGLGSTRREGLVREEEEDENSVDR